jgi:hypothetical protein
MFCHSPHDQDKQRLPFKISPSPQNKKKREIERSPFLSSDFKKSYFKKSASKRVPTKTV